MWKTTDKAFSTGQPRGKAGSSTELHACVSQEVFMCAEGPCMLCWTAR